MNRGLLRFFSLGKRGVSWMLFLLTLGSFVSVSHATRLHRSDVSANQLFRSWVFVQNMLKQGQKGAVIRRIWKKLDRWNVTAVLEAPSGLLRTSWLADARAGKLVVNTSELSSLRFQFNSKVSRRMRELKSLSSLDLTGVWTGVWQEIVRQQFSRSRLRLLFALKLLPGILYGMKRAALQSEQLSKFGGYIPGEPFEETLLALAHQEKVMRVLLAQTDTRHLWQLLPWGKVDLPMKRLVGKGAKRKNPEADFRLIKQTIRILRRNVCSFCPVYSSYPMVSVVQIRLKRGTKEFFLNRNRYQSLMFRTRAELYDSARATLLNSIAYIKTFDRLFRAKGPQFYVHRKMFERNLLLIQVRRHSLFFHGFLAILKKPKLFAAYRQFYQRKIKKSLGLSPKQITRMGRIVEEDLIRRSLPFLHNLPFSRDLH